MVEAIGGALLCYLLGLPPTSRKKQEKATPSELHNSLRMSAIVVDNMMACRKE